MRFLREDCKLGVANTSPGIYHVDGIGFPVYIIVTGKLPPEEFLYLSCVTDDLEDRDKDLLDRLEEDFSSHRSMSPQIYDNYLFQLYTTYSKKKGGSAMAVKKKIKSIYEMNLVELSEENARQKAFIDKNLVELSEENANLLQTNINLSQKNASLSDELEACKKLIESLQKENWSLKQK